MNTFTLTLVTFIVNIAAIQYGSIWRPAGVQCHPGFTVWCILVRAELSPGASGSSMTPSYHIKMGIHTFCMHLDEQKCGGKCESKQTRKNIGASGDTVVHLPGDELLHVDFFVQY